MAASLSFCRHSLMTSAALLVAVALVVVFAVIPPVWADLFRRGAPQGAAAALGVTVAYNLLAGFVLVVIAFKAIGRRGLFAIALSLLGVLTFLLAKTHADAAFALRDVPAMHIVSNVLFACAATDLLAWALMIVALFVRPHETILPRAWPSLRHLTPFLVTMNLAAFALFLVVRSPAELLDVRDDQGARMAMSVMSGELGDPIYIAGRAVWGGKYRRMSSRAFDAYFLANAPSFLVASYAGNALSPYLDRYVLRPEAGDWFFTFISWVTAALFIAMSTLQWFVTGSGLSRLASRWVAKHSPVVPNIGLQRTRWDRSWTRYHWAQERAAGSRAEIVSLGLGACLGVVGAQAMGLFGGSSPSLWKPGPLLLVVPYSNGVPLFLLPIIPPAMFWLWSAHLFRGTAPVPRRTVVAFGLMVFLSGVWFLSGWRLGMDYQPRSFEARAYAEFAPFLSIAMAAAIAACFVAARRHPTFFMNTAVHFLLFAWAFTYAFPYLGS